MMCELCDLNTGTGGFIITTCHTCHDLLIVSRQHKLVFDVEEMVRIGLMFKGREIRWEMRRIHDHAHAHILEE